MGKKVEKTLRQPVNVVDQSTIDDDQSDQQNSEFSNQSDEGQLSEPSPKKSSSKKKQTQKRARSKTTSKSKSQGHKKKKRARRERSPTDSSDFLSPSHASSSNYEDEYDNIVL